MSPPCDYAGVPVRAHRCVCRKGGTCAHVVFWLHQPVRCTLSYCEPSCFPQRWGKLRCGCQAFLAEPVMLLKCSPCLGGLVWPVAPARWLHPHFPEMFASRTPVRCAVGHGPARRCELVRPSPPARGVSPGLGDPGAAPAAGAAGPGAPGPGKAPDRGDPWRTHGVPAPAEAQALGGHRLGRGPGAAALDPGHRHADPRVGKEGTPGGARLGGPRTTSS